MVSHTAGTPTMMEGRKALMSPSQLRTDASVRVWGRMGVSEMKP
jgi:hypothetical protein